MTRLLDIDGTVNSAGYLHVQPMSDAEPLGWSIEQRDLAKPFHHRNAFGDDGEFNLKNVLDGVLEGCVLLAEVDEIAACATALQDPDRQTLQLIDLRVDWDYRRQGIGSALAYSIVAAARKLELRAVMAETHSSNLPAALFLQRCGFELSGIDLRRYSNHDLVREQVSLFWYMPLD